MAEEAAEAAAAAAQTPSHPPERKPRRPTRPNYNKIHTRPLPLHTQPIPAFHPTNPLSLVRVLYALIAPHFFPSEYTSHRQIYNAYLSSTTNTVQVTDQIAIRALWEQGFFGKGSLSRSEPEWLESQRRRRQLLAQQGHPESKTGVGNGDILALPTTSDAVTDKRREVRREEKRARALKEHEDMEAQLRAEGKVVPGLPGVPNGRTNEQKGVLEEKTTSIANGHVSRPAATEIGTADVLETNQEHLQLTPEETLFLTFGLGVLGVFNTDTHQQLSVHTLLQHFRRHSHFPPLPPNNIPPDDRFIVSYVAYHHFRSLGWVVRPGIKFGADWLLYYRGPAFTHAEFAVMVLPAYTDAYWRSTPELSQQTAQREAKSWVWLHSVNRVQGQAKKTLVLVYVEVPPSSLCDAVGDDTAVLLKLYRVHEFVIKRWSANLNREIR